ncbi:MAG TPA: amino acid ABC transporter permease [Candidatus Bathyarchaeia archaeon]|nr:amino acid ABC transporter permease [Candidatus Bathyarchaeia archaeon]
MFEFLFDPRYYPLIPQGLLLTIEITLFGVFLGLVIGTLLAIGDIYGGKVAKGAIAVYVELFRGSPLFVQLFIAVYTVPTILNIQIDHYFLAFLVFGLNSAGYQKGYVKGAMETIYNDQMDAGMSTGMSRIQTLRYVILPQAYRIVIPSWTNEFCSLTKSTATLAFVGLFDLVSAGISIRTATFQILPVWLVIAAIYFVWITSFAKLMDVIYEKKKIPGVEFIMQ